MGTGSLSTKQDIQILNNFSITVWINIQKGQLKNEIIIAKIGNEIPTIIGPDNIILTTKDGNIQANVYKSSNFTSLTVVENIKEDK